ncbi:ribonuclease-III-like-domain-containing protein [Mycena sp. CBHHK59/15]|nr:ribonuclease-III-like-domain-containing protein [Mycena sp. CBHHK59/15]
MSRSLSARCLNRTVFSHPPPPSQSSSRISPGARQFGLVALKKREQPEQHYPGRRENPPPYPRTAPREPSIRLQQDYRASREDELPLRKGQRADGGAHGRATEVRGEGSGGETAIDQHSSSFGLQNDGFEQSKQPRESYSSSSARRQPDAVFSEHLNGLFPPLKFPVELAARILTHGSHPAAIHGHNAKVAFIGRRVLTSYLLLLLASSPHLKPTHDLQKIPTDVLSTYFLGEQVGSKWGLGRVMRWTPTIDSTRLNETTLADRTDLLKTVGLYKVQGDAVSAVMGGIFQQFGASVAHRVFHTRVLPRLLLPQGGLPVCFHPDALEACERLGGARGKLLLDSDAPPDMESWQHQIPPPSSKSKTRSEPVLDDGAIRSKLLS